MRNFLCFQYRIKFYMKFEKSFMTKKELMDIGLSKGFLDHVYLTTGQRVAFKQDISKKTSPIIYDTDELKNFIYREMKIEQESRL